MPNNNPAVDPAALTLDPAPGGRGIGNEVPSPCISVCVIDPGLGYCSGCYRTLDEIADWINLDSTERRQVWDALSSRKAADEER